MLGEQSMLPSPSPLLKLSTYLRTVAIGSAMLDGAVDVVSAAIFPDDAFRSSLPLSALDNSEGAHAEGLARRL